MSVGFLEAIKLREQKLLSRKEFEDLEDNRVIVFLNEPDVIKLIEGL